jgi:hypothetical protein
MVNNLNLDYYVLKAIFNFEDGFYFKEKEMYLNKIDGAEMNKVGKKLSQHLAGWTIQDIKHIGSGSFEALATKDDKEKIIRFGCSELGLYLSKIEVKNKVCVQL